MLEEFCFNYAGREYRLLYPPSRPTNAALHEIFQAQAYPYLPFLAPAKVILDVGANVGFATVLLAALYPTASIYAFEPGRDAHELLRRNTATLPQVQVLHYGLLNAEGTRSLFHGRESSVTNSLGRSCHNEQACEQIHVRRAATVFSELGLKDVTLLKLDTEGAEVAILTDLQDRLAHIDAILLEYHAEADRRVIDGLLAETHLLYACRAKQPHRGTLVYVCRRVIQQRTEFDRMAIEMHATDQP